VTTGPKRELTADELRELLTELGRRLQAKGVGATLYIVGGAAIALELDARRVTADIDAIFEPAATIAAESEALADERGLPRNWLNNNVGRFVPGGDHAAVVLDIPGLAVSVGSPAHLLAMKMASYRPGKDQSDLELLFERLGVTTAEQAADISLDVYGEYSVVLPDRAELILSAQAIVDRLSRRRSPRRTPSGGRQGRKPAGTPVGGQFTVAPRAEPDVHL
jgi:hypothetical protein